MTLEDKLKENIYLPELQMNSKIADYIHNIIEGFNINNDIHLLGKCNGAWIVTLLLEKSDKYKGLYLAVPGIPYSVTSLSKLDKDKLAKINFVFGWIKQDGYNFNWGRKSFEEKERYDMIMSDLNIKDNYKSELYDNGCINDATKFHEIYPNMINIILESVK